MDGCDFRNNTILQPGKWVFRILQEQIEPRFSRCGNVRFRDNLVVFERSRVPKVVNIGPNTRPETFQFHGNHWFASDAPDRSQPLLPSAERDAVHGIDPKIDLSTMRPHRKLPAGQRNQ